MSLTEVSVGAPDYQEALVGRMLDLRTRLGELSAILYAATEEQKEVILAHMGVTAELNERWQYHQNVHQTGDSGRCDECPRYDPASLVPRPATVDEVGITPAAGIA